MVATTIFIIIFLIALYYCGLWKIGRVKLAVIYGLIIIGGGMNILTIGLNGGKMPMYAPVVEKYQHNPKEINTESCYKLSDQKTRLVLFIDRIPKPVTFIFCKLSGIKFIKLMSVGDILLSFGVILACLAILFSRIHASLIINIICAVIILYHIGDLMI